MTLIKICPLSPLTADQGGAGAPLSPLTPELRRLIIQGQIPTDAECEAMTNQYDYDEIKKEFVPNGKT